MRSLIECLVIYDELMCDTWRSKVKAQLIWMDEGTSNSLYINYVLKKACPW